MVNGGVSIPAAFTIVLIPFVLTPVAGRRAGAGWTVAAIGLVVVMGLIEKEGLSLSRRSPARAPRRRWWSSSSC